MNIKAVLFDLDGTLIDSRASIIKSVLATTEKFAPGRFTYEGLAAQFGTAYVKILETLDEARTKEIINHYAIGQARSYAAEAELFPGVLEGLEQLNKQGFTLGIVTNQNRLLTEEILRLHNIHHYFECIISCDDVLEGKPSPEPITKAVTRLGLNENECLMVGDSHFDIMAAINAGVHSALIESYGKKQNKDCIPSYTFSSLAGFFDYSLKTFEKERLVR